MELTYQIKGRVGIIELKRNGIVTSIYISESGTQYNVRFFCDCKPDTIYFYDHELCSPFEENPIGIK